MDENRRWNAYAVVYYGVKAFCVLWAAWFAIRLGRLLFFFVSNEGLSRGSVQARFFGLPVVASIFAVALLLKSAKERSRWSTRIMSLVLAAMAWWYTTMPLNEALPLSGVTRDDISEGIVLAVRFFLPLVAAWEVHVVSRAILAVVANRSQRPVEEAR